MSDIVAKGSSHRVDNDAFIAPICQMLLQCAIGSVGIADEDPETTVDEIIEL